jgi:hypothetical protein
MREAGWLRSRVYDWRESATQLRRAWALAVEAKRVEHV